MQERLPSLAAQLVGVLRGHWGERTIATSFFFLFFFLLSCVKRNETTQQEAVSGPAGEGESHYHPKEQE